VNAAALDPKRLEKQPAIVAVKKRFGIADDLIQAFFPPYIYVNHNVQRERGQNPIEVQRAASDELNKMDGVWLAVPSGNLDEDRFRTRL
jgi:hypothetical protein